MHGVAGALKLAVFNPPSVTITQERREMGREPFPHTVAFHCCCRWRRRHRCPSCLSASHCPASSLTRLDLQAAML